jgi:hypothetical protein
MKTIMKMVATSPLEDNSELEELYVSSTGLFGQFGHELQHVVEVVGGSALEPKHGTQPGAIYTPYSRKRQADAVKFLNEQIFKTPMWIIDTAMASRIEVRGMVKRINDLQLQQSNGLLSTSRLTRLVDYEARAGSSKNAYTVADLVSDVTNGIFSELNGSSVAIDVYRRGLQSGYIDQLNSKLHPPPPPAGFPAQFLPPPLPTDAAAAIRGELVSLRAKIRAAVPKAANNETRLHLQGLEAKIGDILEGDKEKK